MKKLFVYLFLGGAFSVGCTNCVSDEIKKSDSEYPFMILRMMTRATENHQYQDKLIKSLEDSPNTFDEVWLSSSSYIASVEDVKADALRLKELAPKWEAIKVSPAFQLGTTLGHCKTRNTYGLGDDDYKVADNGSRNVYLCASSPKVKTYFYERVKALLSTVKLSSFWLDDDFRTALTISDMCYCKRCIDMFNAQNKSSLSRKEIVEKLTKDSSFRQKWVEFNNAVLCDLAKVVAKARNDSDKNCRLGLQTINPYLYNYQDYPALIDALADGGKTSIRIGSGYYEEFTDRYLFHKIFGVMYEAERCANLKNVGQICYEAENYPHISMQKTPRAMMLECSLMLASGCDSLSLYWHDVIYEEPLADYKNFASVAKQWRPYFERIAKLNKGTRLWGIGKYVEDIKYRYYYEQGRTRHLSLYPDPDEYALMHSAFPMRMTNGYSDVLHLTEPVLSKMTAEEIKKALSKNCIVEHVGLGVMKAKGVDVGIEAVKTGGSSIFHSRYYESCNGKRYAMKYDFYILQQTSAKKVTSISEIVTESGEEVGLAMCVVDTEFGGKLFVVGGNGIKKYPTAYRRSAMLDGLDTLSPMPVRLETSHAMVFIPRVDSEGEFANATIYNYTRGDTLPLKLRVRSKKAHTYRVIFPAGEDIVVKSKKAKNGDGYILNLPALAPVSVMTIYREN